MFLEEAHLMFLTVHAFCQGPQNIAREHPHPRARGGGSEAI